MSADDLLADVPPLRKIGPLPDPPAPPEQCRCGSTEFWPGFPPICKKCRAPFYEPGKSPAELAAAARAESEAGTAAVEVVRAEAAARAAPEEPSTSPYEAVPAQNSLPGFPSDPVPHAPHPEASGEPEAAVPLVMNDTVQRRRPKPQISLFGEEHDPEQTAPREFELFDENIAVDFCCPRCQYVWSGAPKPTAEDIQETES